MNAKVEEAQALLRKAKEDVRKVRRLVQVMCIVLSKSR